MCKQHIINTKIRRSISSIENATCLTFTKRTSVPVERFSWMWAQFRVRVSNCFRERRSIQHDDEDELPDCEQNEAVNIDNLLEKINL